MAGGDHGDHDEQDEHVQHDPAEQKSAEPEPAH